MGRTRFLSMYQKILVALENGRADETLLPHIGELARLHGGDLRLMSSGKDWTEFELRFRLARQPAGSRARVS